MSELDKSFISHAVSGIPEIKTMLKGIEIKEHFTC